MSRSRTRRHPSASAKGRRHARLNRALAATAGSRGDEAPDRLAEATDELRRMLDASADWTELLDTAMRLVNAISSRQSKHSDLTGYRPVMQILTEVADRVPAGAGAMVHVFDLQADYHTAMALRLPSGPAADEHWAEAITSWRAAIQAVTPPLRHLLPYLHASLGMTLAHAVLSKPGMAADGIRAGIEQCHVAIKLAGRSSRMRSIPELTLGKLLVNEVQIWMMAEPSDDGSVAELEAETAGAVKTLAAAERFARRARRHGGFGGRVTADRTLAEVHSLRAALQDDFGDGRWAARALQAWRAAARKVTHEDPIARILIGRKWASWAESTGNASWCAEAYAYLMSVVPSAVAARYLAGERDRVLAQLRSTAEEAGYWLAEDGQIADAVLALELGRALSLSEVLGLERPDLVAALQEAGTPPRFEEIVDATQDGPVVYLAAASRSGYAIIVTSELPPMYRPLPDLTRDHVTEAVESFLYESGHAGAAAETVATTVGWLWTVAAGQLAEELPTGSLVTLVPVGQLSLLPVHAAGGPTAPGQDPADWCYLADKVTVRYAHNWRPQP